MKKLITIDKAFILAIIILMILVVILASCSNKSSNETTFYYKIKYTNVIKSQGVPAIQNAAQYIIEGVQLESTYYEVSNNQEITWETKTNKYNIEIIYGIGVINSNVDLYINNTKLDSKVLYQPNSNYNNKIIFKN